MERDEYLYIPGYMQSFCSKIFAAVCVEFVVAIQEHAPPPQS